MVTHTYHHPTMRTLTVFLQSKQLLLFAFACFHGYITFYCSVRLISR